MNVAEYLRATRGVEGWFFPIDAYLFAFIDSIQQRERIAGDLFEIGVHHGKTAIFLGRLLRAGESLGVCDVFERQNLNADHSGEGSRELFLRNMQQHAGTDHLRVFPKLSSELTAEDTTTRCRFFHIDGGHRADDVVNDLTIAARALLPDGVVAVDDLFNPNWPGVSEGFYQFIHNGVFVPLIIGGNKVFLTRPDAAPRYARYFPEAHDPAFDFAPKQWLGREVLTAIRRAWVDLDPIGAARVHGHAESWLRRKVLGWLG
ncbi:MAG TPA: class I SAM-dependent methyltransferase [Thermoanaerobaculia bacterium]